MGGLADRLYQSSGFTRRRPPNSSGGVLTRRILPGPCGKRSTRHPGQRCSHCGNQHLFSLRTSWRVASSFLSKSTSGKSTASACSLSVLHFSSSGTTSSAVQSPTRCPSGIFLLEHSSVFVPGAICEGHVILMSSCSSAESSNRPPQRATSGSWKSPISNSTVHHQSLPQGVGHNLRKIDVDAASHVHNRRPIRASEPEERHNAVAAPPNSSRTHRHCPPRCRESASSATCRSLPHLRRRACADVRRPGTPTGTFRYGTSSPCLRWKGVNPSRPRMCSFHNSHDCRSYILPTRCLGSWPGATKLWWIPLPFC